MNKKSALQLEHGVLPGTKADRPIRPVDEFRKLYSPARRKGSRLISLKVPEDLLEAFKTKARLHDVPYQTQIKRLMMDWLSGQSTEPKAAKRKASRRRGGATNV